MFDIFSFIIYNMIIRRLKEMKYEIMLGILFDLLSKKSVTARYLSDKYGVSVRSIYRYINTIELAGIPLYTVRGVNGGFRIVDTYKLPSTFLTVSEFEQTLKALSAINDNVPDKTITSVIAKLQSGARNEYGGFAVKGGNLIIDAGPWGDTVGYKSKLRIIQNSIDETLSLSIKYHDRNGEVTERIIEPHIILFKQGLWYVYAYCNLRKDFRLFKIGRIEKAILLKTKFIRQDVSKHDLPLDYWHETTLAEKITIKINKKILSDIEEWLGVENIYEKNGEFIAEVSLPYDNGLISKIMSYGENLTVLEPKKLSDNIKEICKKIYDIYNCN